MGGQDAGAFEHSLLKVWVVRILIHSERWWSEKYKDKEHSIKYLSHGFMRPFNLSIEYSYTLMESYVCAVCKCVMWIVREKNKILLKLEIKVQKI